MDSSHHTPNTQTTGQVPKTDRTRLRRAHQRGHYDREIIDAVLDAGMICHVGYVQNGSPVVMPTLHWREGDYVYWHGSSASRGLKAAVQQVACLTVTHLDGLVLARSAMHHSVNFRSVMVFGCPERIEDPEQKRVKLQNMIEHLYPGRWDLLRPITDQEIRATGILRLPLTEASCKIRAEGVNDDEADYDLPIWAGVVPITQTLGPVQHDPRNLEGVEMPEGTLAAAQRLGADT